MKTSIVAGDIFGDLTVTRRDGLYCVCSCKCGPDREVRKRADHLRSGATRSCGSCVRRGPKPADHVGERHTCLVIVENLVDGYSLCRCDCGTQDVKARYDHLKSGHVTTCGRDCRYHDAVKDGTIEKCFFRADDPEAGEKVGTSKSELDARIAANLQKLDGRKQNEAAAARAMGFTINENFYWVRDSKRFNAWFDRASNTWQTSPA